jgi:hypothetical protein
VTGQFPENLAERIPAKELDEASEIDHFDQPEPPEGESFMPASGFTNQGTYQPDNLIAGQFPRVSRVVTILTGANLVAGSVLGKITANSKFKLAASASGDGSQVPDAILAEDCDATAADKQAVVYYAGEFNELALTFGAGITADSARDTLRDKSILLTKNQGA